MIENITAFIGWHEFLLVVLSMCLCWILVALRRHIPRLTGHAGHLSAVQAMHTQPRPRVGGIAIFVTLWVSLLFVPVSIADTYGRFMVAASLLFIVGLLEDLGFSISPRNRLLAAAIASLAVISLIGVWLPRADIPGLDALLLHWSVGGLFTILLTAGIANGFNMIDGANGLASLTALIAAVALSLIADQAGYTVMVQLAIMLAAGILGFLLVNYPFGLIFLGDAGAYTMGFVLSWFGIAILVNAPEASPWAILLTMFWPAADMLLAIYRRSRRKTAAMAADRLHAHQMVMRALEICVLGRKRRNIANPMSTFLLAPFILAPPVAGVVFWNQPLLAFLAAVIFGVIFFSSYATAPVVIHRYRRRVKDHRQGGRLQIDHSLNNRAENSHLLVRRPKRVTQRFRRN